MIFLNHAGKRMYKVWFIIVFLVSCTTAVIPLTKKTVAQSEVDRWQSDMLKFGEVHCSKFSDPKVSTEATLANVYYDAAYVFYQIADYTGNKSYWQNCARKGSAVYRRYVKDSNGAVPGYWIFPDGLINDWERFQDAESLAALKLLLANGSFVNNSAWVDANQPSEMYLRETAYALALHIQSPRFGVPRNLTRINQLKKLLLGHLFQQYIQQTGTFRKPFMAGLAADALGLYYDQIEKDPAIITTLSKVADYLRTQMWLGTGFRYTDNPVEGTASAPDLNLLIAPMYFWLYEKTKIPVMQTFGDEVFKAGVLSSYLTGGKQFNQNYRLSFKYLKPPVAPAVDSALVCKEVLEAAKICQGT